MKILLTGADGFTGKHFTEVAILDGHEIIPLTSDLRNRLDVIKEIENSQFDVVLHLAGISFVGHANEGDFYSVNVVGSVNLLDALVVTKKILNKIVLASSANVYGNSKDSPIAETFKAAPINHYAMSKLAMEYMAKNYFSRLPITIARPFNYTGTGQSINFLVPKLADHFDRKMKNVSLGNIDVEREFNDVRDISSFYLELLKNSESGEVYNLCSGQTYSLRSIVKSFEDLTGHKIKISIDPKLVRPNEVIKLCGNPTKLNQLNDKYLNERKAYSLTQTLLSMLQSPAI